MTPERLAGHGSMEARHLVEPETAIGREAHVPGRVPGGPAPILRYVGSMEGNEVARLQR